MNVYDFDKTIYRRDSSTDFILFLYRKKPSLLRFAPRQAFAALRYYVFRSISKTQMKERFFSLFSACDAAARVPEFWSGHRNGIYDWYKAQHREDDVIISASPRFLLEPVCRELGITRLIASEVDPKNGCFVGENCHGAEKLRRFRAQFPDETIHEFYSDSRSDTPLAEAAEDAFLIARGGKRVPW